MSQSNNPQVLMEQDNSIDVTLGAVLPDLASIRAEPKNYKTTEILSSRYQKSQETIIAEEKFLSFCQTMHQFSLPTLTTSPKSPPEALMKKIKTLQIQKNIVNGLFFLVLFTSTLLSLVFLVSFFSGGYPILHFLGSALLSVGSFVIFNKSSFVFCQKEKKINDLFDQQNKLLAPSLQRKESFLCDLHEVATNSFASKEIQKTLLNFYTQAQNDQVSLWVTKELNKELDILKKAYHFEKQYQEINSLIKENK